MMEQIGLRLRFKYSKRKTWFCNCRITNCCFRFGGSTSEPSNPAIVNNSEEFNGTSWAEGDNLNTARYVIAGAGTQTAGLGFGGYTTSTNRDESEEYNGTSWSEGDNLNTARGYLAGCGTQTAGLAIQGFQDGGEGEVSKVEEYNGTSWTEVTNAPFTSRKIVQLEFKQMLLLLQDIIIELMLWVMMAQLGPLDPQWQQVGILHLDLEQQQLQFVQVEMVELLEMKV